MRDSPNIIRYKSILGSILKFSQIKKIQLYLVGGFLRDIILKRLKPNLDIDFAVKKNAIKFAHKLAKRLKAGFVLLDRDNGCARLVNKSKKGSFTLDFTDFRGRDLQQDLGRRDFTINTLAVELKALLEALRKPAKIRIRFLKAQLIDPYQGLKDIRSRIIRIVNNEAFDDDPLRIMRTFSLSCILNFKIQSRTLSLAKKKRNKLKRVAFERIRDELFKILVSARSYDFLNQLERYRILEIIIPEIKAMRHLNQGPYHHLDVWKHTLETIRQLEKIISNFSGSKDIHDYLNEEVSSGRRRCELIKLAALLHDIGKPKTLRIQEGKITFRGHERVGMNMLKAISGRLKLSNNEISTLGRMVLFHLRPGYLADNPVLTQRAKFRFFRDTANEAISILLISLADQRATKGYLTTKESRQRHERVVRRLINDYFQKKKAKQPKRLINGNDLIKRFKLQPSVLIGKILSKIEEAQAIGKIKNKQQALRIAKAVIKKRRGRDE